MVLTRAKLERFTAFDSLDIAFSPGVNVFVGENGTGKTHLMKVCYAACDVTTSKSSFGEKLVNTMLPRARPPGRLVKRRVGRAKCNVWFSTTKIKLGHRSRLMSGQRVNRSNRHSNVDGTDDPERLHSGQRHAGERAWIPFALRNHRVALRGGLCRHFDTRFSTAAARSP